MSEQKENGGPAFPQTYGEGHMGGFDGLSMRDFFAAKAMQALIAAKCNWQHDPPMLQLCCDAYEFADAMLKARSA